MAKRVSMAALGLLLLVAVFFAGGYWVMRSRTEQICGICNRRIKQNLGVVAEVGGVRRHVCCARCAITEAQQQHKPLHIISVTDHMTGKQLDSQQAWYVEESRAIACDHDSAPMDQTKHADHMMFDRCSPGAFAFARREDADTFVAQNGGVVRRLAQMLAADTSPAAPVSHDGEVHQ